eukprot:CFRG5999T1
MTERDHIWTDKENAAIPLHPVMSSFYEAAQRGMPSTPNPASVQQQENINTFANISTATPTSSSRPYQGTHHATTRDPDVPEVLPFGSNFSSKTSVNNVSEPRSAGIFFFGKMEGSSVDDVVGESKVRRNVTTPQFSNVIDGLAESAAKKLSVSYSDITSPKPDVFSLPHPTTPFLSEVKPSNVGNHQTEKKDLSDARRNLFVFGAGNPQPTTAQSIAQAAATAAGNSPVQAPKIFTLGSTPLPPLSVSQVETSSNIGPGTFNGRLSTMRNHPDGEVQFENKNTYRLKPVSTNKKIQAERDECIVISDTEIEASQMEGVNKSASHNESSGGRRERISTFREWNSSRSNSDGNINVIVVSSDDENTNAGLADVKAFNQQNVNGNHNDWSTEVEYKSTLAATPVSVPVTVHTHTPRGVKSDEKEKNKARSDAPSTRTPCSPVPVTHSPHTPDGSPVLVSNTSAKKQKRTTIATHTHPYGGTIPAHIDVVEDHDFPMDVDDSKQERVLPVSSATTPPSRSINRMQRRRKAKNGKYVRAGTGDTQHNIADTRAEPSSASHGSSKDVPGSIPVTPTTSTFNSAATYIPTPSDRGTDTDSDIPTPKRSDTSRLGVSALASATQNRASVTMPNQSTSNGSPDLVNKMEKTCSYVKSRRELGRAKFQAKDHLGAIAHFTEAIEHIEIVYVHGDPREISVCPLHQPTRRASEGFQFKVGTTPVPLQFSVTETPPTQVSDLSHTPKSGTTSESSVPIPLKRSSIIDQSGGGVHAENDDGILLGLLYTNRGLCYSRTLNYDGARNDWKMAIEKNPTDLKPYINIAKLEVKLGHLDAARNYFLAGEKCYNAHPTDRNRHFGSEIHDGLALLTNLQSAFNRASSWCSDSFLSVPPIDLDGDAESEEVTLHAIELLRRNCPLRTLFVLWHVRFLRLEKRDFDRAVDIVEELLKSHTADIGISEEASMCYFTVVNFEAARVTIKAVFNGLSSTSNNVIDEYSGKNQRETTRILKTRMKLMTKLEAARKTANRYYNEHLYAEAVSHYSAALGMAPDHIRYQAIVCNNRAAAHRSNKRMDLALIDCKRAIALYPSYLSARRRYATFLVESGKINEGVCMLEEILLKHPDDVDTKRRLERAMAARITKEKLDIDKLRISLEKKTHYEVLGVNEMAKPSEIKKAYHHLARKWHPDKNSAECSVSKAESDIRFKRVQQAYELLNDQVKRKEYDITLASQYRDSSGFWRPRGGQRRGKNVAKTWDRYNR